MIMVGDVAVVELGADLLVSSKGSVKTITEEASTLGMPPGFWPKTLEVVDGTTGLTIGQFVRSHDLIRPQPHEAPEFDGSVYVHRTPGAETRLVVLND